jgi:hypothetical protein
MTKSELLAAQAERVCVAHPGAALFIRLLLSEYKIAVTQANRLERWIHERVKDTE